MWDDIWNVIKEFPVGPWSAAYFAGWYFTGWYFKPGSVAMLLWHDPLSSKDLLEACVVFAMGLMFVIAFRWKK
jgi:hypothetical protein